MQALVSVIIPTKNRKALLQVAIESVTRQSYSNWEIVIVDDDSTDDTLTLASQYVNDSRLKFLKRPSEMLPGANSCRNYGLQMSKGEWIKWLDSDDVLEVTCIEKQIAVITPSTDVSFCQADYFHEEGGRVIAIPGKVWGKLMPKDVDNVVFEYLLRGVRWQTACGLWRKKFLPEKPFLEGLQNSQEWLMHLMMLLPKPKMTFVNESLVHVRTHTDSMSNARNKSGDYYYHQCLSRVEALRRLRASQMLERTVYKKLARFILWNHLFIAYKGSPLKGLTFFRYYPFIIASFFSSVKSSK
jgi:glycosyltransferase involved in cell wall biosynthesis